MITKVAAAIVKENKLLVVSKKKYPDQYMLPGGKPEHNESKLETLSRELHEELKLEVVSTELLGTHETISMFGTEPLTITVFLTEVSGEPAPDTEIHSYKWIDIDSEETRLLGSGITEFTLPLLRRMNSK
ncbi:NUDIX hydrolase [Priestia megaterium]|jgi:8-oxo-dGTP diphosphatase|uniref:NUDIX hydrolase n=1 Tax=Priestia megaterium TaxID=1404 RepID=A0AAE5P2Y7_PRIMG|nr:NUDIX domain-containing protein [Priestia megaterium]MEB2277697.1 NUDIX domain-containing protein [Bacillus sp. ILBB4]PES29267.1 NUDIX hydrolase [Priestia megaterium]PGT76089.1 NUDIX hydrolase [Priestia megaterium]PGX08105.1 NUDIX hydrolase [Priestia megaterium]